MNRFSINIILISHFYECKHWETLFTLISRWGREEFSYDKVHPGLTRRKETRDIVLGLWLQKCTWNDSITYEYNPHEDSWPVHLCRGAWDLFFGSAKLGNVIRLSGLLHLIGQIPPRDLPSKISLRGRLCLRGAGSMRDCLYSLLNFAVNLKTALKKRSLFFLKLF